MERLTMTDAEMEEIRQYSPDFDCPIKAKEGSQTLNFCDYVCDKFQHNCPFMNMGHRLKTYEDAEEQGLLLRFPCKIGDKVYTPCAWGIESGVVGSIEIISDRVFINNEYGAMIGEAHNVFLTKEEAEQALKQMGE